MLVIGLLVALVGLFRPVVAGLVGVGVGVFLSGIVVTFFIPFAVGVVVVVVFGDFCVAFAVPGEAPAEVLAFFEDVLAFVLPVESSSDFLF